jgi:hypothetical protein
LRSLADAVYPQSTPNREARLGAIAAIAANGMFGAVGSSSKVLSTVRPELRGTYSMFGPQFGVAMRGVPGWAAIGSPKIERLFGDDDPFTVVVKSTSNAMVRLPLLAL